MKKIAAISLGLIFATGMAHAWPIVDGSVRAAWGSPATASITADNVPSDFWLTAKTNVDSYDQAAIAMIAITIVPRGGYFCTIQLQGSVDSGGHSNAYTTNFNPVQGRRCLWLCEPGYEGANCEPARQGGGCDNTVVAKATFSGLGVKYGTNRSGNIENSVHLLDSGYHAKETALTDRERKSASWAIIGRCVNKYEVDVHVGVIGYLANGHGVQAAPVRVAAYQPTYHSRAGIYAATISGATTKTLCAQGYAAPGCNVFTSAQQCQLSNMCTGWSGSSFKDGEHKLHSNGSCNEFRCKTETEGFVNSSSYSCTKCDNSMKEGVASNGICVVCPDSQYWDRGKGSCQMANESDKDGMVYGSASRLKGDIEEQCWTKFTADDYLKCVTKTRAAGTPMANPSANVSVASTAYALPVSAVSVSAMPVSAMSYSVSPVSISNVSSVLRAY